MLTLHCSKMKLLPAVWGNHNLLIKDLFLLNPPLGSVGFFLLLFWSKQQGTPLGWTAEHQDSQGRRTQGGQKWIKTMANKKRSFNTFCYILIKRKRNKIEIIAFILAKMVRIFAFRIWKKNDNDDIKGTWCLLSFSFFFDGFHLGLIKCKRVRKRKHVFTWLLTIKDSILSTRLLSNKLELNKENPITVLFVLIPPIHQKKLWAPTFGSLV